MRIALLCFILLFNLVSVTLAQPPDNGMGSDTGTGSNTGPGLPTGSDVLGVPELNSEKAAIPVLCCLALLLIAGDRRRVKQ